MNLTAPRICAHPKQEQTWWRRGTHLHHVDEQIVPYGILQLSIDRVRHLCSCYPLHIPGGIGHVNTNLAPLCTTRVGKMLKEILYLWVIYGFMGWHRAVDKMTRGTPPPKSCAPNSTKVRSFPWCTYFMCLQHPH